MTDVATYPLPSPSVPADCWSLSLLLSWCGLALALRTATAQLASCHHPQCRLLCCHCPAVSGLAPGLSSLCSALLGGYLSEQPGCCLGAVWPHYLVGPLPFQASCNATDHLAGSPVLCMATSTRLTPLMSGTMLKYSTSQLQNK